MLELKSICRRYGDVKAVDDVSFSVSSGEVIGLLGHNGAGKTTIMKIISGFLEPDSGSVFLDDNDVTVKPIVLQRALGYLPENLPVYPELTVAEYLDYAADLKGLPRQYKRSAVKQAVAATELGDKLSAPIATLSRGFKQRAGVAQAILDKPSLLILDEPTNGLDPSQTDHMRQLIRQLSSEATVILSTHIMQEVEAICDRAIIVRQGKLAIDASLADLSRSDQLLLSTDAETTQVRKLLADMHDISDIQPTAVQTTAGANELSITIRPADGAHSIIAEVTRKMVTANLPVFGIRVNSRNLQSLFVDENDARGNLDNNPQEGSHAA